MYKFSHQLLAVIFGLGWALGATAIPVTLTKLTGTLIGGSPNLTAVWGADLSALGSGNIASISILDSNSKSGGAPGQFSGFDLDAIKLSNTNCLASTHACADAAVGLSVFDFNPAGTLFTPGTQRLTADPKLFGTNVAGTAVDNSVATLGAFDGNATTATTGPPPLRMDLSAWGMVASWVLT